MRSRMNSKEEQTSLIDRGDEKDEERARAIRRNFITMAVAFSANHGAVVSCLAYASAQLGDSIGGTGSGVLYVFYAITAFLFSKPVVSMVGPKVGLCLGVGGYCVYVIGFLLAIVMPSAAMVVFSSTCAVGGIAGGLLWTAQGRYFSLSAAQLAKARGSNVSDTTSELAAVFAACYLGEEAVAKVLATVLFVSTPGNAPFVVFTVYTAIAVLALLVMMKVSHLDETGSWAFDFNSVAANTLSAGHLLFTDAGLALMIPFQVAFGLASSFVPFYIFGTVIGDSDQLGGSYIGLLSAVIVVTGALTAIPAAWAANTFGKTPVMIAGGLGLFSAGFALILASDDQLGTWAGIIPYLIIYGIGRGTWENTNKAVIADLFVNRPAGDNTSAFAIVSFTSGLAGAIGYFTFSNTPRDTIVYIITVASILAIVCYIACVFLTRQRSVSI